MKKDELLKECCLVATSKKVADWYEKNLQRRSQGETVNDLERGVTKGEITVREALCLALVVGYQWSVKFEGVN